MASLPTRSAGDDVEALVLRHRPLARHLAHRYVRATDQRDDLEQVAYLGLVKAAQRFDLDRGTAFTTFAVPTILGELRRHCRDTRWACHVPRPVQERVQALRRLEDDWQSDGRRPPSVAEAARALGCSDEEILDARLAAGTLAPESLNAVLRSDDGTISESIDRLAEDEAGFEAAERRDSLGRALSCLDNRARRALRLRAEADLTIEEIAARLGLSPSQAGRVLAKGLRRLRLALQEADEIARPRSARRLPSRAPAQVRLDQVLPDAFAALTPADQEAARRDAVAPRLDVARGERFAPGRTAHLVLTGTVARPAGGASQVFGAGALIREDAGEAAHWHALEPASLAVLDASVLRTLCRWPRVVEALLGHAARASRAAPTATSSAAA